MSFKLQLHVNSDQGPMGIDDGFFPAILKLQVFETRQT
jgi:hypothetical protein